MNAVDIAILTVVGVLAVVGMRRGFVLGSLDLLGVAVAIGVAAVYYRHLINPLVDRGISHGTAAILAFSALNVAALFLVSLITRALFHPLLRWRSPWPLRWSNGVLGLIPGALKGLALAAVVVLPLAFLQRPLVLSNEVRDSRLASPLIAGGLDVLYEATDRYDIDLGDFAVITSRPAEGPVELPFKVTSGLVDDNAAATDMLVLVNRERATAGLDPVVADADLAAVAVEHSEEMFQLGYFAHVSPVSGEPSDRLKTAGIQYIATGENLAYAPSLRVAHVGLMNSPGHRANILNPRFTRLGIGVARSPNRGMMFTQEFAV